MPVHASNKTLLNDGFSRMADIIKKHVMDNLDRMAENLPLEAAEAYLQQRYGDAGERGPRMTGNTYTGYGAGTYLGGRLQSLCLAQKGLKDPVRVKLTDGEAFQAGLTRYDGAVQRSSFTANVATDQRFSAEFVRDFVSAHNLPSESYALRLATGTEYSAYLQSVRDIDVLTGFFDEFGDIVRRQWYWKKLS